MHSANSLDDYLSTVALIRDDWQLDDHKELWFRAEDAKYIGTTSLQPGL